MSYFNEDQLDYMRSLNEYAADELCYCGWFPLGQCHSCPSGWTAAHKLAVRCPECHNAPWVPTSELNCPPRPIIHRKGCSMSKESTRDA